MIVDWNSLTDLEQWAGALHDLLDAARLSILSGNAAQRDAARAKLIEFVMESPNSIAIELDELARAGIDAFLLPARDQAAASVASQMAELSQYLQR